MSYIELNIENLEETREKVRRVLLEQEGRVATIKNKVEVCEAKPHRSRRLFAVDSGFNSAYETSFTVFKSAVVNEDIEIQQTSSIYLFHVDNYRTDRLRRLLMQQSMYESLLKTVDAGIAQGSVILVDGTITLGIFYPTFSDSRDYREHFKDLYENIYTPLVNRCVKENIIFLGFLKRTGSRHLAEHLGVTNLYDLYIMNTVLQVSGKYIPPIRVVDSQARSAGVSHSYVTFYLNLKGWNYRFELVEQQADHYKECIETLLFWATEAHHGMNPVFSKADECARVTKREANLVFNYLIHSFSKDDQLRLRLEARKKTHFGYRSRNLVRGLLKG